MKLVGAVSAAVLSLSLGVGVPSYAQQDQHDQQEENKDKAAQEKEKKQPAKQEERNAQERDKNKREEGKTQEQHSREAKTGKQEEHAGNNIRRIPDDRFRANFGREHRFRVNEADYRRDRRFQYGGYWFGFAQPWPANWLYTQDVYVIEINGVYYLCNESFPGVNVTLSVSL